MPFGEFRQWCEADDELDLQQQAYEEDSGIWMLLFGFCLMTRTPFASVRPRSSFLRLTGDWSQDQTALMDIVRRKMALSYQVLSLYRKHLPAEVFDSAADREMSEGDEGAVVSPTASIGDEEFFSLDPPPPEQSDSTDGTLRGAEPPQTNVQGHPSREGGFLHGFMQIVEAIAGG
ncbi:unnamed protein product [Vitrella brassicaformis CCMP3155]|uniref:Uncharacterized protein n=2 Tax=Vitrella brassicaformis TaxID=1169539 RepID=A0A0G4EQ66_VITBC|nr:unnamed protein product [Vitrella brassicaformis CCMP3155]|eukprot:CEL99552.1 unnamed protein product [Vitrella brassicaformis CCMP3155]